MFSFPTILLLFLTLFTTSLLSAPLPTPYNGISITEKIHHNRSPDNISPPNTSVLETSSISDEETLEERDPQPSNVGVKGEPDLPFGLSRVVSRKRDPEASNVGVKGKPNLPFGLSRVVSGKREAYDPVGIEGEADFPFGLTEDK